MSTSQIISKQIDKLKFGIYINESGSNFMKNLYDHGILFWYYKIQGANENILMFESYVNYYIINILIFESYIKTRFESYVVPM